MNLFIYTLVNIAGAIVATPLVLLLIILMVVLYLKNKKIILMQKLILGGSVNSSLELTLSQFVLGIIGGSIASLVLSSLGLVFSENSGIVLLFFISILLAFAKPRLICFSYSGAILGGISIFLNFIPQYSSDAILNVDILYLITFIGVFHIVEGILVMIDGDRGAVPVFTDRNGDIIGGYALKRYWVLPIAVMIAISRNDITVNYATDLVQSPNWWPLIKSSVGLTLLGSSILSMLPFYTMLGYSSVTFTRTKREKAVSSGLYILVYGIILMVVAQISKLGILGEIFAVIFMPFAHEFMLRYQAKVELKRAPKFTSDEEGLSILEISSDSKAKKFGISIGNKLLSINDTNINSEADVYPILKSNLYNATLKVKDSKGVVRDIEFKQNKNSRLGILLVPRNVNKEDVMPIDSNSFRGILRRIENTQNEDKKDEIEKK